MYTLSASSLLHQLQMFERMSQYEPACLLLFPIGKKGGQTQMGRGDRHSHHAWEF